MHAVGFLIKKKRENFPVKFQHLEISELT